MLTLFGKFSRKLRIDNGELLKDMAGKLGVTSSYLSAVENGKRNVPQNWVGKLTKLYSLTTDQHYELRNAAEESKINNKVDLKGFNNEDKDLVMALARKIDDMDEAQKVTLKNLLNKNK
ncbi:hypothetical protein SAMN05216232_3924 [Virgibacillus subterraneus]|uniref:HTH cro/C1-type domain-containing protein n=1 Tax=Virgibacillus subterraneus TaxID=621109 RepID=A0A1H9KM48_9BACI|nr:helix-turn-helix transcriptional regulator [Virgibacillus subterraneus]SER00178.1 hypothetical protein SAMN05216232_3924 [Virgibacillus subterraneus]